MPDSDRRQLGLETISKVYGSQLPQGSITPAGESRFIDYMLESIFSELWTNETLSLKERRLLLLGLIAAQGEDDVFVIQIAAALENNELTEEQIKEIIVFLAPYGGYPKISKLYTKVSRFLRDRQRAQSV